MTTPPIISNERDRRTFPRRRLLLADDHAIFADALRLLLEQQYEVVGVVSDGRMLVTAAVQLNPDVIIVDVGMPALNGLDAAKRVKEHLPDIKVVFLTMQNDPNLAAAASELGKVGFVLKQQAASELLTAIDCVLHGKSYITPRVRSVDWVEAKSRARQFAKELSPRQRDIVLMFAEGLQLKEIAARLALSQKTIQFHKYHIMEQYNLKSNADLVLFALRQRLIMLDTDGSGGPQHP
jgi:DNA-binding NarL/FixJ family response regulator